MDDVTEIFKKFLQDCENAVLNKFPEGSRTDEGEAYVRGSTFIIKKISVIVEENDLKIYKEGVFDESI